MERVREEQNLVTVFYNESCDKHFHRHMQCTHNWFITREEISRQEKSVLFGTLSEKSGKMNSVEKSSVS